MPLYHTDAGTVETLEWGDGPELIVLLHAAATGPRSLAGLAEHLAAPGRRIVAPALHGYGGTRMHDCTDRLHAHVCVVAACLRQHAAERRLVFGHSMGGLVALLAAMAGPPLDALVLYEPIVTACLRVDDPADAACLAWDRAILRDVQASIDAGRPEAGIARFIDAWNEAPWATLPAAVRTRLVSAAPELAAEMHATSFCPLHTPALAAIEAPALILQGERSPEITWRMTACLEAAMTRAQRVIVTGASHMGPAQSPVRVANALAINGFR